jgi:hypothetical protein
MLARYMWWVTEWLASPESPTTRSHRTPALSALKRRDQSDMQGTMRGVTFASNLTNHIMQRYPLGNHSCSLPSLAVDGTHRCVPFPLQWVPPIDRHIVCVVSRRPRLLFSLPCCILRGCTPLRSTSMHDFMWNRDFSRHRQIPSPRLPDVLIDKCTVEGYDQRAPKTETEK